MHVSDTRSVHKSGLGSRTRARRSCQDAAKKVAICRSRGSLRGQQHGKAKYTFADGTVDLFCFKAKRPVGQGVRWSADRARAAELQDGQFVRSISLEEAAQIAARIGLPVP